MPLPNRLRFQILLRDGYTCQYCGAKPGVGQLEVDHIHPRVSGGKDDPENLLTACFLCNRGKFTTHVLDKHQRSIEETAARVLEQTPEAIVCIAHTQRRAYANLLALMTGIPPELIHSTQKLSDEQMDILVEAGGRLEHAPVYVKEM